MINYTFKSFVYEVTFWIEILNLKVAAHQELIRHLCFSLLCVQGGSGGPADPAGSSSAGRCRETIRSGGSLGQDEGPAAAHNRSHSALQVHTPVLHHPQVLLDCLLFANFSTFFRFVKGDAHDSRIVLFVFHYNNLNAPRQFQALVNAHLYNTSF